MKRADEECTAGGQSQVLVLGKLANGTVIVQQGLANATVTASTNYESVR